MRNLLRLTRVLLFGSSYAGLGSDARRRKRRFSGAGNIALFIFLGLYFIVAASVTAWGMYGLLDQVGLAGAMVGMFISAGVTVVFFFGMLYVINQADKFGTTNNKLIIGHWPGTASGYPTLRLPRRSTWENAMEQKLKGKVALVTGAARGLGRSYALRLAALGADVGVIDIDLQSWRAFEQEAAAMTAPTTMDEVRALGCRSAGALADVASFAQVQAAVAAIVAELGEISWWSGR